MSIKVANEVDKETNKIIYLGREERYLNDTAVDFAYGKEIRVFQLQKWLQSKLITPNNIIKL